MPRTSVYRTGTLSVTIREQTQEDVLVTTTVSSNGRPQKVIAAAQAALARIEDRNLSD